MPVDLRSKEVAQRIQDALLRQDHGIWYQEIKDVYLKGKYVETQRIGKPILTPGFCKLYSLPANYDSGIIGLVDRKDYRVVTNAIRKAMHPEGRAVTCTVQMKGSKVIEVYCRRLKLKPDLEIFVSLHTDLSAANEWHGIQKMVLDYLPGFVFVKRWCPERKKFLFVYINRALAIAFSEKNATDAEGKTDSDYIADTTELRHFRRADLKVLKGETITEEENLTPKQPAGNSMKTFRLATIKMPYIVDRENPKANQTLVLGIAFDISPITGLLRNIVDQSKDAIYVKDTHGRYTMTNPQFLRLLGLSPDADIINKTFAEVINLIPPERRTTHIDQDRVKALIADVRAEDQEILGTQPGIEFERVRAAWFSDAKHWISRKILLDIPHINLHPTGQNKMSSRTDNKFILGVSRSLFGGIDMEFFERLPQCVCVKDENYKVVWCNEGYAARHGQIADQLTGQDDYSMWPPEIYGREIPDQFRAKDRIVLEIGRKYRDLEQNPTTENFRVRWSEIEADLRRRKCIEYREFQPMRDGRGVRTLQTTKWPEFLAGQLFVVVVYSDVTVGDQALEKYHRMTVHTLRSAMLPFDAASTVIERAANESDSNHLRKAASIISIGLERTHWFFNCHLKLLKMKLHKAALTPVSVSDIRDFLKEAVTDCRKISNGSICVSAHLQDGEVDQRFVLGEPDFLKAVIFEILRNAHVAIQKRVEQEPSIAHRARLRGEKVARKSSARQKRKIEVGLREELKYLAICVGDDGLANVLPVAKDEVVAAYKQKSVEQSLSVGKFGVAFCLDVIKRLGGKVRLEFRSGTTLITICLPYYAK